MTDAHVHIERGPYKEEWIKKFIDTAKSRGINEIYLLEHSHRFIEFKKLYSDIISYNEYQRNWLSKRLNINIENYVNFIKKRKIIDSSIKIKWGLEICYIKGKEKIIEKVINKYNFNFITGSVHWINGWGFDHKEQFWNGKNIDEIYDQYYIQMFDLVNSGLFDHLAHPDSIKCFNKFPVKDQRQNYENLSKILAKKKVKAEYSSGLYLNYNYPEIGFNDKMYEIFKNYNVEIITASDAHRPEDVGIGIKESYDKLLKT